MCGHTCLDSPLLPDPVSHSEAIRTAFELSFVQSMNTPTTQLNEILDELEDTNNTAAFILMLNSAAPFDKEPTRDEVSDSTIQNLFDSHLSHNEQVTSNYPTAEEISNNISIERLTESLSQFSDNIDDAELQLAVEQYCHAYKF